MIIVFISSARVLHYKHPLFYARFSLSSPTIYTTS